MNVNPPPTTCTGCGLCSNLCPAKAISMIYDDNGFLVPKIDETVCINCSACYNKCTALTSPSAYTKTKKTLHSYGGWNNNNDVRLTSSSGGIFPAIAKWVFMQSGCVYGVIWENISSAKFTKAENIQEIFPMKGSKYIQANTQDVYKSVKMELSKGRIVLFTGLPCQIYALKSFLSKPYDNLITIDIVCHGVPSSLLLTKYIDYCNQKGKQLSHIKFRDKTYGWTSYNIRHIYSDGSSELQPIHENAFMRIFLSDRILNTSCYQCCFVSHPRQGDLSLGDFWGASKFHPEWPIQSGVSAIVANTVKGLELLDKIKEFITIHPTPYENFLQHNGGFNRKNIIPKDREKSLQILKTKDINQILNYTCNQRRFFFIRINKNWFWYKWLKIIKKAIKSLAK